MVSFAGITNVMNMVNMDINLSEIEIIPVRPQKGLLAYCSFVINNAFCVNDVGIHISPDGRRHYLFYPVKTLRNGKSINIFYPSNRQAAQAVEEQVVKAFLKFQEKIAGNHGRE